MLNEQSDYIEQLNECQLKNVGKTPTETPDFTQHDIVKDNKDFEKKEIIWIKNELRKIDTLEQKKSFKALSQKKYKIRDSPGKLIS